MRDVNPAAEWEAEFEAAARRPLRQRFKYAFIRTYKPVLDDESYRAFDTSAEYRPGATLTFPSGWAMAPAKFEYTQE